jgi:hypothetical protein
MKRYFGTTSSTIASINSVARTLTGITINGTEAISLWTRTEADINGFPAKYNGIFSKNRQAAVLPGSNTTNTLITTDGLILLIEDTAITVADLFDSGTVQYSLIKPEDYEHLVNFITNFNPQNKRVFLITGRDEDNNFKTKYEKVYINLDQSYFQTDMDLDLPTDEYGYYRMPSIDFGTESIKEVTDFYLIKRQFYLISAPTGTELYLYNGSTYDAKLEIEDTSIFWFSDFQSDNSDKLLRFKLKNSSEIINTEIITIY